MKTTLSLVVFLLGTMSLGAQQAAVTIAEQIVPATENLMGGFVGCVERLVAVGTSNKDSRRDCLKLTGKAAKLASDVSDDASGAANANRPVVVSNGYGYGGYSGYSSSYYSRPVGVHRSAPERRQPQPRQPVPRR